MTLYINELPGFEDRDKIPVTTVIGKAYKNIFYFVAQSDVDHNLYGLSVNNVPYGDVTKEQALQIFAVLLRSKPKSNNGLLIGSIITMMIILSVAIAYLLF